MKNYFEMRGQANRLIFNLSTDEFCVEALVHPFVEAVAAPVDRSAEVVLLPNKRQPKSTDAISKKRRLA